MKQDIKNNEKQSFIELCEKIMNKLNIYIRTFQE